MATRRTAKPDTVPIKTARRPRAVTEDDATPRPGEELAAFRRRCPWCRWVTLKEAAAFAERDPSTLRQKKGVSFYEPEGGLVDIADADFQYLCNQPSRKPSASYERQRRLGLL